MKKKKEHKHPQAARSNPSKATKVAEPNRWKYYNALLLILLLTFIAFLPVFQNGFFWDDEPYIQKNPLLSSFNIKEIFSQFVLGNYHPFTILTLATEYHFFGLNATGYHAVNLLLHLLNVILVFCSVFLLSNKAGVALVAALLFGIHPLHVESVAWAAELKDLLYTFFFLASFIFYLKYLKAFKKKYYVFALILFSVSLLSKAMAASLPVVLVLTDYFKGRKINIKTLLEKAPFFLLALALGVVAIFAQKSSEAIQDLAVFSFPQRLTFACYGFITYLLKLLLPQNLCVLYPYPVKNGAEIPSQYYAYVILFLGLLASVFYSLRFSKKIIYGIGFFAATVFLVLQLLPVGGAIMADRYSYIPSIGIFYLAGEGLNILWNKKLKWIVIILLSAFTIFFSIKTYARCGVWKNEMTLWNDVISQYQNVPFAYYFRGHFYMSEKRYDDALNDYSRAIELKPNYTDAYINRGNILFDNKRYDDALKDYNNAIGLNQNFSEIYNNRGNIFKSKKIYSKALDDYSKAIELKPNFAEAYYNRGIVFYNEKRYEEAISDYTKTIELKAGYAEAFFNRGLAEYYSEKKDAACRDFKQADSLGLQKASDAINKMCK